MKAVNQKNKGLKVSLKVHAKLIALKNISRIPVQDLVAIAVVDLETKFKRTGYINPVIPSN